MGNRTCRRALLVCVGLWAGAANAKEQSFSELLKAFNWDLQTAEIKTEKVGDGLYVLFGVGGNIAVSIGADGVFIVDDQFPELMPKIQAAIEAVGGKNVNFAVNTHWHFDHADGNKTLGPAGTWLVSQANSRTMMMGEHVVNGVAFQYRQKAYPPAALPVITYNDTMQFFFNDGQVDLKHYGPAHTTGDTAVFFRAHNAVHLGDVYNNAGYPFIDVDSGGDLDGVIKFCEAALAELNPGGVVIPGHGPVARDVDLAAYIAMLKAVRAKMAPLVKSGASLEQVAATKPTAEWDKTLGDPVNFINRAYTSLVKQQGITNGN